MFTYFDFFLSIPKPGAKSDKEHLRFKLEDDLLLANEEEADKAAFELLAQFRPEQNVRIEVEITETHTEIPTKYKPQFEAIFDGWIYWYDDAGKPIKLKKSTEEMEH